MIEGHYKSYSFYKRDSANSIMKIGYTNQDDLGTALEQKYLVDNQNRIVKREVYHDYATGKKINCFENITYNKQNLIQKKWMSCDKDTTYYQYDAHGNIVKHSLVRLDSTLYEYNYRYSRNTIYEHTLNSNDEYRYIYKYDKFGNWIEYKQYTNRNLTYICMRDIVYYE